MATFGKLGSVTLGLVTVAMSLASLGTGTAVAQPPVDAFISPDASWGVEVTYTDVLEEPALDLAPGQSKSVKTAKSETTYVAVSASCTETLTKHEPTRGTRDGQPTAFGRIDAYRSSGCPDTTRMASMHLDREACGTFGCNWRTEVYSGNYQVDPGRSIQILTWKKCGNTNSDRWRTAAAWNGLSYGAGPAVWLNCGM